MPRKDANPSHPTAQAQQDATAEGIHNFELPKTLVTRIAKSAIPDNAKLQKETVLALVKGSTVFINYLAATAHDIALSKQHKSISASDILKALELIEFGDMVGMLQGELQVYKENQKGKKNGTSISAVSKAPVIAKSTSGSTTKGKAKAVEPEDFPTSISAHLAAREPGSEAVDTDVDAELPEGEDEEMADASEPGEDVEDVEEDEEVAEEEEEEEEETVDMMAVEDEEIRKDALSIERREKQELRDKEELAAQHHQ